jgi:hypothetical protein
MDWGLPAFLVWLAMQLEEPARRCFRADSPWRLATTILLAGGLLCGTVPDREVRWSAPTNRDYIKPHSRPGYVEWLPGAGGIIYNPQMGIFYRLLYSNPHADWRYVLGFEPTFMTPDNFVVYRRILAEPENPEAYSGWVKKMRPQDRMMIERPKPLAIQGLEWKVIGNQIWVGRLPRAAQMSAAAVK